MKLSNILSINEKLLVIKNNYNFITRFANRKRNRIYMRSKKKEKKIYIYIMEGYILLCQQINLV